MSHPASPPVPAISAEDSILPASRTTFTAFLTAIGAIVLIGSEIWIAAIAAIWAADGVFGFATIGDIILIVLIVPPALWATVMIAKLAIAAEMDPENAD